MLERIREMDDIDILYIGGIIMSIAVIYLLLIN